MSFRALFAGSVTRDAHSKAADLVSVKDFGAKGDGVTDDKNAFIAAIAASSLTQCIFVPDAVYAISDKLTADHPICFTGRQWRLLYTGMSTVDYVLGVLGQAIVYAPNQTCGAHAGSCYGDHTSYFRGLFLEGIILDGQGNATNGLTLQGVISGNVRHARATNVLDAGFMCNWCQQIAFEQPMVSSNFEAFTTTPARCLVIDSVSSANIVNDINCEHVTDQGIDLVYALNTTIKGGTSEGIGSSGSDKFGVKMWGNNPSPNPNDDGTDFHYNINNSILNLDLEENHYGGDISCGDNCYFNTFYGTNSFSIPGITLFLGAHDNSFFGGTMGAGSSAGAQTSANRVVNMSTIDITGTTIWVDNGFNHVDPIFNQYNNNVIDPINQNNRSQKIQFGPGARPIELFNGSIGTIADIVVGKSSGAWIGLFSQDGVTIDQAPFLHYKTALPGMCFLGEPTLRASVGAQIDGCIVAHKWGIGGGFAPNAGTPIVPVSTLHVLGFPSDPTTVWVQATAGQGTNPLMDFRDATGNSFGGVNSYGLYLGATHSFGATFTVSGCTVTGSPVGGATAGRFTTTSLIGTTCVVQMGTAAGQQVTAGHSWACTASGDTTGALQATGFNTVKAAILLKGADNITFGCIGY